MKCIDPHRGENIQYSSSFGRFYTSSDILNNSYIPNKFPKLYYISPFFVYYGSLQESVESMNK